MRLPNWAACRLDYAQMGSIMTFMNITKYVKAVARIVNDELTRENIAVANAAQKSGIPRTTLMRRLEHPDLYPFTIAELAQISDVLSVNLSTIIQHAEALASEEGE